MRAFTTCTLLNIRGAFDNAWHDLITKHLKKKNYSIYLIFLIHSFLTGRSIVMHMNESNISTSIEKGCPQGSTLFLSRGTSLLAGIKIQAYTVDLVISRTGRYKSVIQASWNFLIQWGKRNKLKFSFKKSELIIFTRKRITFDDLFLIINESRILSSPQVRYSRFNSGCKLTW